MHTDPNTTARADLAGGDGPPRRTTGRDARRDAEGRATPTPEAPAPDAPRPERPTPNAATPDAPARGTPARGVGPWAVGRGTIARDCLTRVVGSATGCGRWMECKSLKGAIRTKAAVDDHAPLCTFN